MCVRMCEDVISQQQHRFKNKVHCHRPTVSQFLPSGFFCCPVTTNHMSCEQFKRRLIFTFRLASFEGRLKM